MEDVNPDTVLAPAMASALRAIRDRITPRQMEALRTLYLSGGRELPDDGRGKFSEFVMMFGKVGGQLSRQLGPRQTGTGGKIRQLGISKRGDTYLRTLLMHGARAIIARGKRAPWVEGLLQRRPYSVAVAAIANKLARTIWAVLSKGQAFDQAAFAR